MIINYHFIKTSTYCAAV